MAKKTTAPETPAEPVSAIEYIGPDGQISPVFGLLVVGQRYQASVTFGDYLVATHPDYWTRPAA